MGKKKQDTINIRDVFQIVAGAAFPTILIFAMVTITAPTIEAGMMLVAFVYIITIAAVLGWVGNQSPKLIFQHLALATSIALPVSLFFGLYWVGDSPWKLFSMNFFTTESCIAFMVGLATGAIADAKRG